MPTKKSTPARDLKDVRREIDTIDDAIQDLLMKRTELVVEVAEAKARTASAAGQGSFIAFRPGREAEVLRRLAVRQTGPFPLKVVFRIFREIIVAMTRIQGPFRVDVFGAEKKLAYWDLARSYYGSSTDMELHENARDVLRRVMQDRSVVGILPEPGNYTGGDWWPALAISDKDGPRVVARLPFLDISAETDAPIAFVVTQAAFEATGDDTSLLVVSAPNSVSEAALAAQVKASGFEGERLGVATTKDGGASRHNLFAVQGYVAPDDARLATLTSEGPAEIARVIGGYANPVKRAKDGE
ncbi:MAG: chorismate mutase [Parvibaculum sp.]|uniref:chorismate mutase n=1 Tax=Parvibaculum sp. TaxID=2024848 RepID=UPI0025E3C40C|nr:chorismate mutase [Parvibaculum sp.]MCE9648578.1 chorismate mutase [Parvibaculum sp.]